MYGNNFGYPFIGGMPNQIVPPMTGNMMVAGTFGFLVPVILKKLGVDPAVSSSIFVTTATDVLGFFIFLSLANVFLPYLL